MQTNSAEANDHFISKSIDDFFIAVYEIARFIMLFFKEVFLPPYEFREVIKQCYHVGYKSLFLISVTSLITGIVFTDHSRPALADFGATSWLPALTGVAIVKALAPLITSLICAGKTGSQIGAELSSMKVTDQVDAMEASAVDPFKFLVVTRVLATTFVMPLLVLYSTLIGLIGSFINIAMKDAISLNLFIHDAFFRVGYAEVLSSLVRALFYGFTIGIVASYKGLSATNGTEGVGRAANSSVVLTMFLIFLEEITIVKLFNPFYSPH